MQNVYEIAARTARLDAQWRKRRSSCFGKFMRWVSYRYRYNADKHYLEFWEAFVDELVRMQRHFIWYLPIGRIEPESRFLNEDLAFDMLHGSQCLRVNMGVQMMLTTHNTERRAFRLSVEYGRSYLCLRRVLSADFFSTLEVDQETKIGSARDFVYHPHLDSHVSRVLLKINSLYGEIFTRVNDF